MSSMDELDNFLGPSEVTPVGKGVNLTVNDGKNKDKITGAAAIGGVNKQADA